MNIPKLLFLAPALFNGWGGNDWNDESSQILYKYDPTNTRMRWSPECPSRKRQNGQIRSLYNLPEIDFSYLSIIIFYICQSWFFHIHPSWFFLYLSIMIFLYLSWCFHILASWFFIFVHHFFSYLSLMILQTTISP